MSEIVPCAICEGTGWVCENHPATPWEGPDACDCGGAGMPCRICNIPDDGERPQLPADFLTDAANDNDA